MSTELPEEKAQSDFYWQYMPLHDAPASWDECLSLLDYNTYIVDKLRRCPFPRVRAILDIVTDIERLFEPNTQQIEHEQGVSKPAKVDVDDENKALALTYHLFFGKRQLILRLDSDRCEQCLNAASFGPSNNCLSGQKHVFGGACFNCVYNGTADLCIFKQAASDGKFLGLTRAIIESARVKDLQSMRDACDEELYERYLQEDQSE